MPWEGADMSEIRFPVTVDLEMDLSRGAARKASADLGGLDFDEFVVSDDWTWGNDTRYCFASGYLHALDHRLISPDRFIRLAEARDVPEALSMLGDTDYARGVQDQMLLLDASETSEIDIGPVLEREAQRVKSLIDDLTQDLEVTDILFVRDDFFNLKLALKGVLGGVTVADSFARLGTIDPSVIYEAVRQAGASEDIPQFLREAASLAIGAFNDTKDPIQIDRVVDAAMFEHLQAGAIKKGVFFLHRLLMVEIDLINILTFFRLRWAGEPLFSLQTALLRGGGLSPAQFYEYFPREIDDIETGFFAGERYHGFIAEGIAHLKNERSFVRMEALLDREILKFIEREREIGFGVESLVAYYYKKSIEMKRLRTIVIGKRAGLPAREIKARLGYVG